VRLAHQLAIESDLVTADMVEASEFPHLTNKYAVMAVPKTVVNEELNLVGALPESDVLDEVMQAAGSAS
jgi:Mg/Co/Ni transporter MgtE